MLGAVTVIVPGAPVKFDPLNVNDCDAEFVNTTTFPKSDSVVAVKVGFVG